MVEMNYLLAGLAACFVAYYWGGYLEKAGPGVVKTANPSYDYVIVGGGAAGCVVAARLSEDDHHSVLLLEAGGEETGNPTMDLPVTAFDLLHTPASANEYSTIQKDACKGLQGGRCYIPRGRGLGGGSSHNCMHYVRGNKEDYDGWAAMGADGWSYKDVLPYFIKSEGTQDPELGKSPYHGSSGPLTTTTVKGGKTRFTDALVKAGVEIGYGEIDHNGESQEGFSLGQYTIKKGERWSTAKAFLRPAMKRKNLHVMTNAFVSKVIFEKKQAVGVEYLKDDIWHTVRANKEVILSAGAIASPKILMLSGVGPKEHLKKHGINLVNDLPVGDNHQDHIMTDALSGVLDPGMSVTGADLTDFWQNFQYQVHGSGKLTTGCGTDGVGFVRTPRQPKNMTTPFMQYIGLPKSFGTDPAGASATMKMFNFKKDVFEALHLGEETAYKDGFVIFSMVLRPFSRGMIRLASTDPFEQAVMDVNYFSDQRDVDVMVDGIRIGQKLFKTDAFKNIGYKPLKRIHPGCKQHVYDSDSYWDCYVRHNSLTVYHSAGTCKMGAANDKTVVVDPQLRVRGIEGLRVVDASVMPTVVAGNTNAPSIMIGEKGADLIRGKTTVKRADI